MLSPVKETFGDNIKGKTFVLTNLSREKDVNGYLDIFQVENEESFASTLKQQVTSVVGEDFNTRYGNNRVDYVGCGKHLYLADWTVGVFNCK